jgi:RNA polymerase sigma factor (TIGR02999 family)
MRQILVDHARHNRRLKRGGALRRVPLEELEQAIATGVDPQQAGAAALLALDDALRRLEQHDQRQSRIVECRFFGGMTIEEALGISPATVKRAWTMAQAWLYRELSGSEEYA